MKRDISNLGDFFECIGDYTKVGGVVDTLEGSSTIQRNLGRLERQSDGNLMKLDKGKSKVPPFGRSHLRNLYTMWVRCLESSFAEKDFGVQVDNKPSMRQ